MSERGTVVAGWSLIAGTVSMFAGASVPFLTSLGGAVWTGTREEQIAAIAGAPGAWVWANSLILAAAVLTAAGLVGAMRWLEARGDMALVRMAVTGFLIGTVIVVGSMVIRIAVAPWASQRGEEPPGLWEPFDLVNEGGLFVFLALAFSSMVVLGLGTLRSGALGPSLLAIGLAGLLTLPLAIPAFAFIGTAVIGVAIVSSPGDRETTAA